MSFPRTALRAAALVAASAAAVAAPQSAHAQWVGSYYQLPVTGVHRNPDVQEPNGIDGAVRMGLVQSTLSANWLPVVTACGQLKRGTGCGISQAPITDVNAAGEIQWWSGNGTTSQLDPVATREVGAINFPSSFFPTGQSNNSTFMRAVRWTGVAGNSGAFAMSLGADDDAWFFVNGVLALDNGGVKAMGRMTSGTVNINAGDRLDVFFADRNTVQSAIVFNTGALQVVPEPSTYALMATGLAALVGVARRRRQPAA